MPIGGAPKCPKCSKSVYFNERVVALGKDWHKFCFKCNDCNKLLEVGQQLDGKGGELFCKKCYGKAYGPTGFTTTGSTVVQNSHSRRDPTARSDFVNTTNINSENAAPVTGTGGSAPAPSFNFCSGCGAKSTGGKFCSNCGKQF